MSTLQDLLAEHSSLGPDDIDQLHRLAGDWQMLADLSFADLLLWVTTDGGDLACVAHVRPTTAATSYPDDQVGRRLAAEDRPHLAAAAAEDRIWRESDPIWMGETPVRLEVFPVRRDGHTIALLGRDTNLADVRVPSQLELSYLAVAGDLLQMVSDGTFPHPTMPDELTSAPRVGDGLLRLSVTGSVTYASPNAQSALRRLGVSGEVVGVDLAATLRRLADDPMVGGEAEQRIRGALSGRPQRRHEVAAQRAMVLLRALPLLPGGERAGVLVLVRDVTEVRRRERQLLSKDATIREIHHRVKNNLQAVASLLRLQSRRLDSPEARAALGESVRRVAAIAMVHETLSVALDEKVDLGQVLDNVTAMVGEVAGSAGRVVVCRLGDFGSLPAEIATPLVLAVTELVQNAVEHGFPADASGTVTIAGAVADGVLRLSVSDDGAGLPADFSLADADRLGLQIVRSLIADELGGTLAAGPGARSGTEVELTVELDRQAV